MKKEITETQKMIVRYCIRTGGELPAGYGCHDCFYNDNCPDDDEDKHREILNEIGE